MVSFKLLVLLIAFVHQSAGHGSMNTPPAWQDRDGKYQHVGGRSPAGCTGVEAPGEVEHAQGCAYESYSNHTFIDGPPTIPRNSSLLTYKDACGQGNDDCCKFPTISACDWTQKNPWRHPGTAPIFSPCGIDGGNPQGCPAGNPKGDGCARGGYGRGPDSRMLPDNTKPAIWNIGAQVEVAWAITANHGGGYSYRLCPKQVNKLDLTEECFQAHPLTLNGETQWIQSGKAGPRIEIPARRTVNGTFPLGSQWTRSPIPACGGFAGGFASTCVGTQFPPPAPGAFGFGALDWNIIDQLEVPSYPAGDYVISFRYDCEETPQVWNQCGDVRLVDAPSPAPPSPPGACPGGSLQNCIALCPADPPSTFKACVNSCSARCSAPGPAPGPAPATPAPTPQAPAFPCDVCTDGKCGLCKQCVDSKTGPCNICWAPDSTGKSCLYDDAHGCQKCWNPSPTPPTPPTPPAYPCAICTGSGPCAPCDQCEGNKESPCDKCWAVNATTGSACLYDDGHGCQRCWTAPPTPPAPAPPTPPPTPADPCVPCNTGGKCAPCKACVASKTGPCAACWTTKDPTTGQTCLKEDRTGCRRCWPVSDASVTPLFLD